MLDRVENIWYHPIRGQSVDGWFYVQARALEWNNFDLFLCIDRCVFVFSLRARSTLCGLFPLHVVRDSFLALRIRTSLWRLLSSFDEWVQGSKVA